MNYGKKYSFIWTPELKATVSVLLVILFGAGGVIGFVVGAMIGCNRNTPGEPPVQNEVTSQVETVPTVMLPDTPEVETSQPTEPEKVYYDCPLDHPLQNYIRELCEENGLPMDLVISLISVESSFRPNLVSGTNDYGLMQINKVNHEWLSEKYGITDFLDPYQNVLCGVKILSQHYEKYQDVDRALMAYNLGATGAKKLWDKGVYETHYVRKVRKALEVYGSEI